MEFENEPEGWDDHIIARPPMEEKEEVYRERPVLDTLVVAGILIAIFVTAACVGYLVCALVWRLIQ